MKLTKLAFIPLALGFASMQANAGVVSATNLNLADSGDMIVTVGGNAAQTGIATAGFFTAGFDVGAAVAASDFASLIANFTVMASGQVGDPNVLEPGKFGLYFISTDYGAPGGPNAPLGAQLYTFFGSGATLGESSLFGLIQHEATIGADTPTPDSNDLVASTGTVLLGEVGTTNYDFGGGAVSTASLNLVPEPSAALLGLLGAVGLIRRRR